MNFVLETRLEQITKEHRDLINKYKTMFNNGDNDGDLYIVCKTKETFRMHSEVLEATSEYYNNIKHTFNPNSEKKLYFEQFNIICLQLIINILYNDKYNSVYTTNAEILCQFFELSELLLLKPEIDKKIQLICNNYENWFTKKQNISKVQYTLPHGIKIIKTMSNTDNKYFNQLRDKIIEVDIKELAKIYLKHNENIFSEDYECDCFENSCIFMNNPIHRDIKLKVIKYLNSLIKN